MAKIIKMEKAQPDLSLEKLQECSENLRAILDMLRKEGLDLSDDDMDECEEDDDIDMNEGKYDEEEDYMMGLKLPKKLFVGDIKRECLVRVKLNNAPVKIWREFVVPANITLETLAFVLIEAMGWEHEHMYQFCKKDISYMNTKKLKKYKEFDAFGFSPVRYENSDKTTLESVLTAKGERIKFEYDFGDSWMHELWIKSVRDLAPNEEPVIKLLKAQGKCPPEDCGGVWGYANLLELLHNDNKTDEEVEQLEWYDISEDYEPEDSEFEYLKECVDDLWSEIKANM